MHKLNSFIQKRIQSQVAQTKFLTRQIHNIVPCQLIPHIRYAKKTDHTVIIGVTNINIARKLRYSTRLIEKKLGVNHVKIITLQNRNLENATRDSRSRKKISSQASDCIIEASNFISDPKLQASLRKLARTSQSNQ